MTIICTTTLTINNFSFCPRSVFCRLHMVVRLKSYYLFISSRYGMNS